jgi:hypothetical protein
MIAGDREAHAGHTPDPNDATSGVVYRIEPAD